MTTPFSYNAAELANLEIALSLDRFSKYVSACGGDRRQALKLYEWNSRVSASFYVPLQIVEVALRNACHRELCNLFGPTWHDEPVFLKILEPRSIDGIEEAKETLRRDGVVLDTPHLIAALSFGFWTTLLGRHYRVSLWTPALRRAFPRIRVVSRGVEPSPKTVSRRVNYLRLFRNRIAHHEPIFSRALYADYTTLRETAAWMFADLAEWMDAVSYCVDVIASRPGVRA